MLKRMQVRLLVIWLLAAVVSVAMTLLVFFPVSWIGSALEKRTAGQLTLGDPQGTLWNGSAFIGGAPSVKDPVTPLLPGRFSWHLSPLVLIGQVELTLENAEALSQPVTLSGSWSQWQVSAGAILLPAERLAGLGAPLNTIGPSGQMRLSWSALQLSRQAAQIDMHGTTTLELNNMASLLSSIRPLGAYRLTMDWEGQQAKLGLKTVRGPLLLSGSGQLDHGRFQFSGKAEAAAGQEETLANLLGLLGQRRREGSKNIIALEFKQ